MQATGSVKTVAAGVHFDVTDTVTISCGSTDLQTDTAEATSYIFGADELVLGLGGTLTTVAVQAVNVAVTGKVSAGSNISSGGTVTVVGSLDVGEAIAAGSDTILPLTTAERTRLQTVIDLDVTDAIDTVTTSGLGTVRDSREDLKTKTEQTLTYYNRDDVRQQVEASLRTDSQYGTQSEDGLLLPQWRWQQYAGDQGKTWEEPGVSLSSGETTFPWPGKVWASDPRQLRYTDASFDLASGTSTPRADSPEDVTVQRVVLQQGYLTNRK
jgi:hypothetical protein